ncbi:MAG: very short patch repair endonuclease [Candidatus Yanofskybacteria bacterium]|nr:very short patch repair endonuclease [Candidatus Yanofskybacteria bacterium]
MRLVKSKETKLEKEFRKELSAVGLRYRKNVSSLPGKPDIVFGKKKLAIFLDSCFWHGCRKHCRLPSSNKKYWVNKIESNIKRGRAVSKSLKGAGWTVIRIWEHGLKENISKSRMLVLSKLK